MREEPSAVASDALRAELMSVPGVASAEVDLTDASAPAGVRVRLTADADARRVGAEVQRVLASHGMRSRFADGEDAPPAPHPEPGPVPIVAPPAPMVGEPTFPPPPMESPPAPATPPEPVADEAAATVPMAAVPDPPPTAPPLRIIRGGLDAVAMEERADGLAVRVTLDDGRIGSHALMSEDAEVLDSAVIAAVADAVDVEVDTVATEWMEVEETSIVTVVLRLSDGAVVAGAGVVRVGRAFAVGMAARSALAL
jgi:hypothetical protein